MFFEKPANTPGRDANCANSEWIEVGAKREAGINPMSAIGLTTWRGECEGWHPISGTVSHGIGLCRPAGAENFFGNSFLQRCRAYGAARIGREGWKARSGT